MPSELIGDEVSSACTSIRASLERAYDLHSRKRFDEAVQIFALIEEHAKCAQRALRVEDLEARGNHDLARTFAGSASLRVELAGASDQT